MRRIPSVMWILYVFLMLTGFMLLPNTQDLQVFANPGDPALGEAAFELEEDLSLGREDIEEQCFFKGVDLTIDADEHIYVLDKGNAKVRKFDARGNHVLSFGGLGQGPGEWLTPAGIRIDDLRKEILVFDLSQLRFVIFDFDGTYLRTVTTRTAFYQWDIGAKGMIFAQTFSVSEMSRTADVVLFDLSTGEQKTIARYDYPLGRIINGAMIGTFSTLSHKLHLCRLGDNLGVYAHDSEYRLIVFDMKGNIVRIIEKDTAPESISPDEKRKDIDHEIRLWKARGIPLQPNEVRQNYPFPRNKPFFRGLVADDLGNIFMLTQIGKDGAMTYDMFDMKGTYRFRIHLNVAAVVRIIRNGFLYGVLVDGDTGYFKVKRYKIRNWDRIAMAEIPCIGL